MDILDQIADAQRDMLAAYRRRDQLILAALLQGYSAYAVAKRMAQKLGEDDALRQNSIRAIEKRLAGEHAA